ncbi:hypothetical protein YC2023_017252 [Brassica napus]
MSLVNPNVTAIANHPPNKTLADDLTAGAFPNVAPSHPKTTSATVTAATTATILTLYSFTNAAAKSGTIAPAENASADAAAACSGLGSFSFSTSPLSLSI